MVETTAARFHGTHHSLEMCHPWKFIIAMKLETIFIKPLLIAHGVHGLFTIYSCRHFFFLLLFFRNSWARNYNMRWQKDLNVRNLWESFIYRTNLRVLYFQPIFVKIISKKEKGKKWSSTQRNISKLINYFTRISNDRF